MTPISKTGKTRGLAHFGVTHPVPANLLMIAVLIGGLIMALQLRKEFFPERDPDRVTVELKYPGATPQEIEESLAIKVEDKLAELDEVDELQTTLSEGGGGITVVFREGVDPEAGRDEIERTIDSLTDLPDEAEKIQVRLFEARLPVIRVVVFGGKDEELLKRAIRDVRNDLRSLPDMGEAVIAGVRDYEIRVDVRREAMLEHGAGLPEIADRIRDWMTDVPGGTVRSNTGNIKVRTMGTSEHAQTIGQIVLRADDEGRFLRVSDIATVAESYVDEQLFNRFNGEPAAYLTVFKVGGQDIVHIAESVRAYVQGRRHIPFVPSTLERLHTSDRYRAWQLGHSSSRPLPVDIKIDTASDLARFVEGRLDLLVRNARYGAILVFITLLLFLNWRVAFWVGVGLLTALMGTLVLMAVAGVTLNLLTMFGLIVVLGLLVDDAIVVSENVQSLHDRGVPALTAAVKGANQVHWPVVATVMTTVLAFVPLTFIRGEIGDLLGALPWVVACALLMSLIESLFILPSHMGHSLAKRDHSQPGQFVHWIRRAESWRDHLVMDRLIPLYARVLTRLIRLRYLTVAAAIGILIISFGLVAGRRVVYSFLPSSDAETVIVDLRMPIGTSIERTNELVAYIERAAQDQSETRSVSSVIGQQTNIETGVAESLAPHLAQIFIELVFVEQRQRESSQIIASIREGIADRLDEVERISFTEMTGGPAGADISIRVRGSDLDQMEAAVTRIQTALAGFQGVHDIADDNDLGQLELQIHLKPSGAALGFTTNHVARQVRGFLHGIDAHVFAAKQEDIDVRVRLDEPSRRSFTTIAESWLISPTNQAVPLSEIARFTDNATYSTIRRVDRQRSVTVTAETEPGLSPEAVVARLPVDEIRRTYPDLNIQFAGRQKQQQDAFASLPLGFLAAAIMIYVVLAWLFSSYIQPVIVMLVIPFSLIGVIWGHLLLGYELTFLSLIGFVALSGIVVNDSLIFVEFFNAQREEGHAMAYSLLAAGRARLRAILLTTLTTVLGLTPLILERSFQAKFLIPMAISIAVGLISATAVVLIVLPCFLLIFQDIKAVVHLLWYGQRYRDQGQRRIVLPDMDATQHSY